MKGGFSISHLAAIIAIVAVSMMAIGVGTTLANDGVPHGSGVIHQTADVLRFDNMADVGDAKLVRTESGVSMTIKSSVEGDILDLVSQEFLGQLFTPGDATTNWFVVFNNPGNCVGDCDDGDVLDALLFGDPNNVMVDVIFATGHIAGSQWRAAAHLSEGDTSGSLRPLFGLEPIGLTDAMTAEIHIQVRSHGPASNLTPDELADAISSILGGCGTNLCGNSQFAVFKTP